MTRIRIIGTTYGYHNASGRIEPKTSKDAPFQVEDAEAERLVSLGYAEIVTGAVATPAIEAKADEAGENTPKNESPAEASETLNIPYTEKPEYSEATKAEQLREIGRNVGITFRVGISKKKMVEELNAFFEEYFDEAPDLTALDPLV